jgi:hydroxymethylglutaryl-CoA lyase
METRPQTKLIECPRDAMQGWKTFIPTEKKIEYLQSLLKVGFHTLDAGSFVSPKAIPQMADTAQVLQALDLSQTNTKLLTIVANQRGAEDAMLFEQVSYVGFPFSVSETFQHRNTNASIAESLERVEDIQDLCIKNGRELVIYMSMGFGNPYGDPYDEEIVFEWVNRLMAMDIPIISLADTVGMATAEQVYAMTSFLVDSLPGTEIGVHLHSTMENWHDKLDAAIRAGCRRFDGALKGIGGCPMANDDLVGNMTTELMIPMLQRDAGFEGINYDALEESIQLANEIFNPILPGTIH